MIEAKTINKTTKFGNKKYNLLILVFTCPPSSQNICHFSLFESQITYTLTNIL